MTAVNWSNFTDFGQLPQLANTASNGSFWVGVLFLIFAIAIIALISWGFVTALTASAFIGLVLSLLLAYSELIAFRYCLIFVGIILFMFLYIMFVDRAKT